MITFGRFGFGIFLTKEDLDGTNRRKDVGFRIYWKPRSWHDVHLYPRVHIRSTRW